MYVRAGREAGRRPAERSVPCTGNGMLFAQRRLGHDGRLLRGGALARRENRQRNGGAAGEVEVEARGGPGCPRAHGREPRAVARERQALVLDGQPTEDPARCRLRSSAGEEPDRSQAAEPEHAGA